MSSGPSPASGDAAGAVSSDQAAVPAAALPSQKMAIFANVNSRSLSMASISSEGSTESHVVEQEDIIALTQVLISVDRPKMTKQLHTSFYLSGKNY